MSYYRIKLPSFTVTLNRDLVPHTNTKCLVLKASPAPLGDCLECLGFVSCLIEAQGGRSTMAQRLWMGWHKEKENVDIVLTLDAPIRDSNLQSPSPKSNILSI